MSVVENCCEKLPRCRSLTTLTRSSDGHGEVSGEMRQTGQSIGQYRRANALIIIAAVFTIDKIGARDYTYHASVCVCECVYVSV